MERNRNDQAQKLEQLKGSNPFSVPEGYMEGLVPRIMLRLPEKTQTKRSVRMMDYMRPWLYLAAVFAGLLLFFKAVIRTETEGVASVNDSLLVRTDIPADLQNALYGEDAYAEDEEYLEYIENEYANYILAEEMRFSE
jgi:hypothetical protein